ncbi:MAG: hypothetical protein ISS73_03100 [Pirellulales bacterium]|nr:hypothetical protein [Pirellulales bacterium]
MTAAQLLAHHLPGFSALSEVHVRTLVESQFGQRLLRLRQATRAAGPHMPAYKAAAAQAAAEADAEEACDLAVAEQLPGLMADPQPEGSASLLAALVALKRHTLRSYYPGFALLPAAQQQAHTATPQATRFYAKLLPVWGRLRAAEAAAAALKTDAPSLHLNPENYQAVAAAVESFRADARVRPLTMRYGEDDLPTVALATPRDAGLIALDDQIAAHTRSLAATVATRLEQDLGMLASLEPATRQRLVADLADRFQAALAARPSQPIAVRELVDTLSPALSPLIGEALNEGTSRLAFPARTDAINAEYATALARCLLYALLEGRRPVVRPLLGRYEMAICDCVSTQLLNTREADREFPGLGTMAVKSVAMTPFRAIGKSGAYRFASRRVARFLDTFLVLQGFASINTENDYSLLGNVLVTSRFQTVFERISRVFGGITATVVSPIVDEYQDVYASRDGFFKRVFRYFMPGMIVSVVAVLGCLLVNPLQLPNLAIVLLMGPGLLLGFATATVYLRFRDSFTQWLRLRFVETKYDLPEFVVNDRMRATFGSEKGAEAVRRYYTGEMRACEGRADEISKQIRDYGGLEDASAIEARAKNAARLQDLCREWDRIHSPSDTVSFQEARGVVEQRLTTDYGLTRSRLMRLMRNRAASTAEIRGQISRATDLFELLLLGQPVGDGELERLSTDAAEPGGDVMARLVLRQLTPQLPPGGAVATYQRVLQLRDIKRSVRALSRDRTAAARLHAR